MDSERSTRDVEDAALLEAYAGGDVGALGRLVERYRRPLEGYIAQHAAGAADAEECYQETWLRALRGLGRFRREHFGAWLFKIARNWLVDEGRRRKPELSLDAPAACGGAGEGTGTTLGEAVPTGEAAPDERSVRADLGRRIRAAAEELPEAQREVFWLRMDAGLAFREIAEVQGCSLGTALARMQYALAKMRAALADDWREFCGGKA
ncbi:MAG: sigma-70 family RNA polymerase sigma factor [Kiritimatiellae bacterium]|nr:sigma-70 family RNA polymerase sigma factor [Kiritimatiellia bacterium]